MKKIICLIITSLTFLSIVSQNKDKVNIYVDEDFKTIEYDEFELKKKSYLYNERIKQSDSGDLHFLIQTEEFGTLKKHSYDSIKGLLDKDYNLKIEKNETVIIHFIDSILGYSEIREFRKPYYTYQMTSGDTVQIKITEKLFIKNRKAFDNKRKSCNKKAEKINIKHIYIYKYKSEESYAYKNVNWYKINPVLNEIFFKNNYSRILIIKPNGTYYKYGEINTYEIEKLLETTNWDPYIETYNKALVDLPHRKVNLFKSKKNYRKYGNSFKLPRVGTKEDFRKAFEQNALSHPVYSNCYGIQY